MIHFFVPGQPQGKGRARAFSKGNGKIDHYTPAKTRSYEGEIKARAMQAMGANKATDKPISLDLALNYEIPKTWPKWKRHLALTGDIVPTVKPDSDNVTKAIKDALNGIAWNDDCRNDNAFHLPPLPPPPARGCAWGAVAGAGGGGGRRQSRWWRGVGVSYFY